MQQMYQRCWTLWGWQFALGITVLNHCTGDMVQLLQQRHTCVPSTSSSMLPCVLILQTASPHPLLLANSWRALMSSFADTSGSLPVHVLACTSTTRRRRWTCS
jgi:hypothetical protein